MNDLVNTLARLQRGIDGAGIVLRLENDYLHITGSAGTSCLRVVRLYRPSSDDIRRESAPDVLLMLTAPTVKAVEAAAQYNHIVVPEGSYRIVAPGIALIHEVNAKPSNESRQVRLMGKTGIIAESLLLGGRREWSVRELAADAGVAPSLAHRAVVRLERETLLVRRGTGPTLTSVLSNPRALAELWSQEDTMPQPFLRGFVYAPSMETLARKVLAICPGGAVGGTLAANLYQPVLTRVPPPVRIWVPDDFTAEPLETIGFEQTGSGANIEMFHSKGDPWRVHMQIDGLPRVSRWRAWREIANAEGRTRELADAMLSELE